MLLGAGPIPKTVFVPAGTSVCPASDMIVETTSSFFAFSFRKKK